MSSPVASPTARRSRLAAVADRLAPAAGWSCQSAVLGTEALLCFDLDRYEHSRRRRAGLGAVVDVGVLDLLLGLPPGRPIDRMGLGGRERRAVAKAPPGCLRVDDRSVIRLARPLVKVEVAVISTRGWRRGLEQAGRFAPFCARAIVLDRAPRDLLAACVEADFYGVGLFLAGEGSPVEMLVAPEPCRAARVSARTWWFTEEVYRAHLAECPIAPGRAASSERA